MDAGEDYLMSALVVMPKKQSVEVLCTMGQVVSKKSPARLELLGAVVCLLFGQNRVVLSRSTAVGFDVGVKGFCMFDLRFVPKLAAFVA